MFTTTSYRKIGFCIYCGNTRPPLTREHVFPKGLGGKTVLIGAHTAAVLGQASCEKCRRITHEFETECQRRMFHHLRLRLGLAQRDIPETIKGFLKFADGSTREVSGHPDDFPAGLILPVFHKTAGLFASENEILKPVQTWAQKLIFAPKNPSLFAPADEIGINIEFKVEPYQRMLAKIALGAAILKHGTNYFTPLICDFIRGKEQAVGKYVFGYDLENERESFIGETHIAQVHEREVRGTTYLVGFIRLFAIYGAPTNGVIIGILRENTPPVRQI